MFVHSYVPANQNPRLMQGAKELIAESATDLIPSWLSSACSSTAGFCTIGFDNEHRISSTDMKSMSSFIKISTLVQGLLRDGHTRRHYIIKKIKVLDK